MKEEKTGPGCLWVIGAVFSLIAVYCMFFVASGGFMPFVGAALVSTFCFALADIRDRLKHIEKHLGVKAEENEEDSNIRVDNIPEVQ